MVHESNGVDNRVSTRLSIAKNTPIAVWRERMRSCGVWVSVAIRDERNASRSFGHKCAATGLQMPSGENAAGVRGRCRPLDVEPPLATHDNSNRRNLGNALGIADGADRGAIMALCSRPGLKFQQNFQISAIDVGKTDGFFSVIDSRRGRRCGFLLRCIVLRIFRKFVACWHGLTW